MRDLVPLGFFALFTLAGCSSTPNPAPSAAAPVADEEVEEVEEVEAEEGAVADIAEEEPAANEPTDPLAEDDEAEPDGASATDDEDDSSAEDGEEEPSAEEVAGDAEDNSDGDITAARPGETRCQIAFEGEGEPMTDWIFRDARGRIVRTSDASDGFTSVTVYELDSAGRVVRRTRRAGPAPPEVDQYTYTTVDGTVQRSGRGTRVYHYDSDGRATRIVDRDGDGRAVGVTTCSWADGRLVRVGSEPENPSDTILIERGANGRATRITNAGERATVTYENGLVVVTAEGDYGSVTTYSGDCEGLLFGRTCQPAYVPPAP